MGGQRSRVSGRVLGALATRTVPPQRFLHISMPTDPRHILIVHVAGLTQTTLALPALRSLRQHLPQSRITVVSSPEAADLLRLAACVDEILPVARFRDAEFLNPRKFYRAAKSLRDSRREHFDLAVQFKPGDESGLVMQFVHSRERTNCMTRPDSAPVLSSTARSKCSRRKSLSDFAAR